MGWAGDNLPESTRREIARGLFQVKEERGNFMTGHCPLDGHPDKHPSFVYNPGKDQFNCYSHPGKDCYGDLVELFGHVEGLGQKEAFKAFLERYAPEELKHGKGRGHGQPSRPKLELVPPGGQGGPGGSEEPADIIPESVWQAMPALPGSWLVWLEKERGWSREVISRMDLRHYVNAGPDASDDRPKTGKDGRIAIPIRDAKGRLCNIRLYSPGANQFKVFSYRIGPKKGGKTFGKPRLWPVEELSA